jgi:uncharacterized protein DUF6879
MELMTPDERDKLFDTFTRDAFHLELRDVYGNPLEDEPLRKWLAGEPDDLAWLQPWLSRMRAVTRTGRTVRRVRVITEPMTDYIRYEWEGTPDNLAAGEDIRWLPRHQVPEGFVFPLNDSDWWLFDDHLLAVGHFDDTGRVLGSELVTDERTVAECARARDQLWELAIPHAEYKPA